MRYPELRENLKNYYYNQANDRSQRFCDEGTILLDNAYVEGMSAYDMKKMQYKLIAERFEPVLFADLPFYYETGTMCAHCDGAGEFREGRTHLGGWTYRKNKDKYEYHDPEIRKLYYEHFEQNLYLFGMYSDARQHFVFNHLPIFQKGLKGVYEEAQLQLKQAKNEDEIAFLTTLSEGYLCIKKIAEKFSQKAYEMLKTETNEDNRKNLIRIAETAKRVPWDKPETFYEALNTHAFLRKALGSLEGIGFSSFGRVDKDLYPYYKKDIENGTMTPEEAYELICKFLIMFDLHYDHDMKMVMYSDHELENTYTLGGCDDNGNVLYNELTKMFLQANREEKIIFPKIKCRFSANSPKEYLDEINKDVIKGTSTILYQNDDATIPALLRIGKTEHEAHNYIVSGCWDLNCLGVEKHDGGNYVNILKPFEYSIHNLTDKMNAAGLNFKSIENSKSFEELYKITCDNIMMLFKERLRICSSLVGLWNKVDVLPLFSSTLSGCMETRTDFTKGAGKYRNDNFLCFGFPNIIDSFLAIKELCFDSGKYSLEYFLNAVRNNWVGYEDLRMEATHCHGWGDGSEESCSLAQKFHTDLYNMLSTLKGTYGGKVNLGFLTYTEIRWWGEKTLATPDGRKNGDYFAQGLTPSRLKKIKSVTSVITSMQHLDASTRAGNSVVNIILPSNKMTLDLCEAFLRAVASSSTQSLQLNCTTKEELLDAQKHPEKYPNLIVRVTGFSAKFTSLSPEWQNEVITRNFYE